MNFCEGRVIGIPVDSSKTRGQDLPSRSSISNFEPVVSINGARRVDFSWIRKFRKRSNNLSSGEHGALHQDLFETVKRKLNLGKRTHQARRLERLLRKSFSVEKDERLIKGCHCYLSTTAGPIEGTLFITTKKVAFCSNKSLTITSPKGRVVQMPYKVSIPVKKVKKAIPSENAYQPEEKYLQLVTVDNFEFWFMGFVNYPNSSKCLQNTLCKLQ